MLRERAVCTKKARHTPKHRWTFQVRATKGTICSNVSMDSSRESCREQDKDKYERVKVNCLNTSHTSHLGDSGVTPQRITKGVFVFVFFPVSFLIMIQ